MGKYPEQVLVKFPLGTKERLRGFGNVQAFIRGAVLEKLEGAPLVREGGQSDVGAPNRGVSVAGEAVLAAYLEKRGPTHRNRVMADLGWGEGQLVRAMGPRVESDGFVLRLA